MRRRTGLAATALMAAAGRVGAWSPDALRLLVAYPPGGVSDRVARLLAHGLEARLGYPVLVDNRPGAGGAVALQAIARSPPDGRVLGFCAISPLTLSPLLGLPAPAVVPVTGVMRTPLLLVGTPALGARDYAGMLAAARAAPGALRWATSGVGTIGHLVLEQVQRGENISVVHVPYAGGGPQLHDALAGRFELLSTNLAPQQLDHVRSGRFTALALGAPAGSALLPGVPTFAEAGCPGANRDSLFGLFAPRATPAALVDRLNAACAAVLAQADFGQVLAASGNLPAAGSARWFAAEIERQAAAYRRAGAFRP
ncbi:tripartite tricarboxylate transporter substrate binding protein [Xylophilus sp. Kf1]|nr:tripartite tricarboxylate transporter substrate binding protein [Xylophilus sp. Kf1]